MTAPRDPSDPAYDCIPAEIATSIPPLYGTENQDDPTVWIKMFTPDSSWTWFITEYDPNERRCFGLVDGHEREFGYFSLPELEELRGPMGLPIERDIHWKPKPISEIDSSS